ncbi:unnamed protein product [Calicophoron daubneyi]|uniref:Uncharacterized protein n=1 Tax=Calicophoron daubneyi TaxID=300641 RepID=A0AAV2T0Q0_CALDB
MSHPASEFRSNSQTRYETSRSLISRCKLILFRWFSSLERIISSDNDELLQNDKQWKRFSLAEMVDDLFSENPATGALALRKTRQLVMDFPDRLMVNVIRTMTQPKLVCGTRIFE